jgi:hypothetical protein
VERLGVASIFRSQRFKEYGRSWWCFHLQIPEIWKVSFSVCNLLRPSVCNRVRDQILKKEEKLQKYFLMHLKNTGYQACDKWIEANYDNIEERSTFHI